MADTLERLEGLRAGGVERDQALWKPVRISNSDDTIRYARYDLRYPILSADQ